MLQQLELELNQQVVVAGQEHPAFPQPWASKFKMAGRVKKTTICKFVLNRERRKEGVLFSEKNYM